MVGLDQPVRFPREFVRHPSYQLGTDLYLSLCQVRDFTLYRQMQRAVGDRSVRRQPLGPHVPGLRYLALIYDAPCMMQSRLYPHAQMCTAVLQILDYGVMLRDVVPMIVWVRR